MIRLLTADEVRDLAGDATEAGLGSIDTARGCLPLTALDIDAQIEGLVAKTTVHQQFQNVFDEPLEATYIFPLPPRAAVSGFRMTVNDAVIEGRISERGQAREDYDAALAAGRTASIAEQERADVFTLRVGNIPAKATARIELSLAGPVAVDLLEATYRFPLVVAPRYCPGAVLDGGCVGDGTLPDTDRVPDASRISPPVVLPGFNSPVRLGIRVRIAASTLAAAPGGSAKSIGCSLPASEALGEDGSLIVTVEPGQRLDRDLIVRFGVAADTVATAALFVEPDAARSAGLGSGMPADEAPGDGTFSLVIVPPARRSGVKEPPRDVVFLLDRSGSMDNWKIGAARRAVARMIDTLTAEDRVEVLAFDDDVEHCGSSACLASATDRHRWSLLEWLGGVEARGGTELEDALEVGLGVFGSQPGRSRLLVVITDCQVGDEDAVVAKLVDKVGDVTLFFVGVDTAVNEGLLSRMVDSTGGMVEMVESEDRLDEVMDRIHERLATPLVSGLAIQAAGLEIIPESLVPTKLPSLTTGVPVVVRGRYRGSRSGGVRIEGRRVDGESWHDRAEATLGSSGCQAMLWARGRLQQLQDVYAACGSEAKRTSLEKRLVELSTSTGVLCKFTAVVAIDMRQPSAVIDPGSMRRIVQPIETARSAWHAASMAGSDTVFSCCSRPDAMDIGESFDGCVEEDPQTPATLDAARAAAAKIVEEITPQARTSGMLSGAETQSLLEAVRRLLDELLAAAAPQQMIESLATAYERLRAVPTDRIAVSAVINALLNIAVQPATRDHWWRGLVVRSKFRGQPSSKG